MSKRYITNNHKTGIIDGSINNDYIYDFIHSLSTVPHSNPLSVVDNFPASLEIFNNNPQN